MKSVVVLSFMAVTSGAFAQEPSNGVVEKRNIPLAITRFAPKKIHVVKTRWRLAFHSLKVEPFVIKSFDGTKTTLGIDAEVTTTWGSFSTAQVVLTADGKVLSSSTQGWTEGTSWGGPTERTTIENADLVRRIANAKELYLTVLFPGTSAPFDQISFKLSQEQLNDCRLLVEKYDVLRQ